MSAKQWKDVALTPQGRHPAERERERKERLLKEAISHFDKGKVKWHVVDHLFI